MEIESDFIHKQVIVVHYLVNRLSSCLARRQASFACAVLKKIVKAHVLY